VALDRDALLPVVVVGGLGRRALAFLPQAPARRGRNGRRRRRRDAVVRPDAVRQQEQRRRAGAQNDDGKGRPFGGHLCLAAHNSLRDEKAKTGVHDERTNERTKYRFIRVSPDGTGRTRTATPHSRVTRKNDDDGGSGLKINAIVSAAKIDDEATDGRTDTH